jgi:PKD repeat protein
LKSKKQDKNLRELFRNKLEYAEMVPDPLVSSKLMHELALKEFLHFNPSGFNIYYLGGMIAAAIVTALLLSTGLRNKDHITPDGKLNEIREKNAGDSLIIPYVPALIDRSYYFKIRSSPQPVKNSVAGKENLPTDRNLPDSYSGDKFSVTPGTIKGSLGGKGFFTQSAEEKLKLQDRLKPEKQLFESSVNDGCAPLKVLFQHRLADYDSCQWIFGDGGSSGNKNAEWIYDVEGVYTVVLKVFGHEGLIATSSSVISVFPKPAARFEISALKTALPENEIALLNYSSTAVKYLWSFGDGSTSELFEPVHRYDKFGNYNVTLKAFSENGCYDSLVVYNALSGSEYFIEFPNAFIPDPNGPSGGVYSTRSDESAQVFHPSFSGVSDFHLKIFSKLGVLLFETNDISIGWDGYFNGQLSNPGVYIWKVRGNFNNGEPFTKMGDVTLLKN